MRFKEKDMVNDEIHLSFKGILQYVLKRQLKSPYKWQAFKNGIKVEKPETYRTDLIEILEIKHEL